MTYTVGANISHQYAGAYPGRRPDEQHRGVGGDSHGKTVKEIILTNTLTFFNLINVVLLVMVLLTFSFKNMLFILIVAINTVIGIVQELRAKKTLDELTILTASKAHAIREGREVEIGVEEIVLE